MQFTVSNPEERQDDVFDQTTIIRVPPHWSTGLSKIFHKHNGTVADIRIVVSFERTVAKGTYSTR